MTRGNAFADALKIPLGRLISANGQEIQNSPLTGLYVLGQYPRKFDFDPAILSPCPDE